MTQRGAEYVLFSQGSTLLLHVKPGNPKPLQQTQPAGLCAVCGQSELHLQQTLRSDRLRVNTYNPSD